MSEYEHRLRRNIREIYPQVPLSGKLTSVELKGVKTEAYLGTRSVDNPFLPQGSIIENSSLLFIPRSEVISAVLKGGSIEATPEVLREIEGYRRIGGYLNIPRHRLYKNESGEAYVMIPFIGEGITLEYSSATDDYDVLTAFDGLMEDVRRMWREEQRPFERGKLERDYRDMSLSTIEKVFDSASKHFGEENLDKTWVINGIVIGNLRRIRQEMIEALEENPTHMVLDHGDSITDNILLVKQLGKGERLPEIRYKRGDTDYVMIDPLYAGYYDLAWLLGVQYLTRSHVISTHYGSNYSVDISEDSVSIRNLTKISTLTTSLLKDRTLELIAEEVGGNESDLRRTAAYAFINVARSISGLRDERWKSLSEKFAVQHFLEGLIVYRQILSKANSQATADEVVLDLVRHGQDEVYADHCHNGRIEDPLTEEGIKESEELFWHLDPPGRIYTSPLQRSVETAQILAGKSEVVAREAWTDRMRYGPMQGVHYSEFIKWPEYRQWKEHLHDHEFKLHGGESMKDVKDRVQRELSNLSKYNRVIVVSHGDTINSAIHLISGDRDFWIQLGSGKVIRISGLDYATL